MPRIVLTDLAIKSLKPSEHRQVQYWDRSLPSFGCRVGPKGTKTFNVMLGKQRRLMKLGNFPAMKLADARKMAHAAIEQQDDPKISFEDARKRFIEEHLATLKPTTARQQEWLILRFDFDKPLAFITQADVLGVVGPMKPGSARSCYNVFRTFVNWAVDQDLISHSPLKPRSPYKPQFRDRVLLDGEIRAIWHESFKHGTFGQIWRCLLLSGQRLSQFAAFDHAWLRDDTIMFPPEIMKSNKTHIIPASSLLLGHIPRLSKPFTALSDGIVRLREALPDIPHHTCHDTRRTFSTKMAQWNICSIDITEAVLDHTSGSRSQIQRIYDRHDRLPQMKLALDAYQSRMLRLVSASD
jgi:integrase